MPSPPLRSATLSSHNNSATFVLGLIPGSSLLQGNPNPGTSILHVNYPTRTLGSAYFLFWNALSLLGQSCEVVIDLLCKEHHGWDLNLNPSRFRAQGQSRAGCRDSRVIFLKCLLGAEIGSLGFAQLLCC